MAESLLAILLVTKSAKGPALVYRWPPLPTGHPRLSRSRPDDGSWPSRIDNPWCASHAPEVLLGHAFAPNDQSWVDDPEYRWQRPVRARSPSNQNNSPSHSPVDGSFSPPDPAPKPGEFHEYSHAFGYEVDFLAGLLLPHPSTCHQKFELLVDDLAFVGHPVCVNWEGKWEFKEDKMEKELRGKESGIMSLSLKDMPGGISITADGQTGVDHLQIFHVVLVCDIPDPSSSDSGNLFKYFDIIYEQIAFTLTAVLFQEQVLHKYVQEECDKLGALRDLSLSDREPYDVFATRCLEVSSMATTIKDLYEAIKTSRIARLRINNFPLELQLPPHLDTLLHNEDETEINYFNPSEEDDFPGWGAEMSFGWHLPPLAPWKTLLLLDEPMRGEDGDALLDLKGPFPSAEDRCIAEGLVKFLETVTVTLSLADVANLLDWDLEGQIYPIVRWLVYSRRAKIIDTIHPGLKNVFTVPSKFDVPLSDLTTEFAQIFNHPAIPPLPRILSLVSYSISKQTENHFYACFVKSKEMIPPFHDVVIWMLKRDLLITLHLRIRVVATPDLKLRVQMQKERALARKKSHSRGRRRSFRVLKDDLDPQELGLRGFSNPGGPWLSLSPKSSSAQRLPSMDSACSEISELAVEDEEDEYAYEGYRGLDSDWNEDMNDFGLDGDGDMNSSSIIHDPARATALQKKWLSAMSDGKDPSVAKRFEQINQYFDGKRSGDEILYRAEISRRQLRETLHHYEEYVSCYLRLR
ncbi:hypothetical protein AGABI2DRAFT_183892 [Agaricus bisporus var. bisporus H97]|uniref:hypothetical protein n=1 Tax=Agaricus bisporus var. bisporus (strain H97 / ATCC MYA-4626 / FGSC 10389) TaxID=936046 RepID=UPI00029F6B5C|nr:hypothetical protein AGABI2DRAFT_183892 [Agaricus bisporus var. bisporus H97]EKV49021.1 hypothetical protein AGABI2DRAFT_183892 [Agaricus bisporus var. bisporus H97]